MRVRPTPGAVIAAVGLIIALLAGCASPGPPLPPSLKLPQVVTDLTAVRVGDAVMLKWTTPARTTDKLLIAGPVEVQICREPKLGTTRSSARSGSGAACTAVGRLQVAPGESEAVDPLPASLSSGPPSALAYRVQLLNAAGRTAGPSPVALAAAGESVMPLKDFRGTAAKQGVVLEWRVGAADSDAAEAVELDRTALDPPVAAPSARKAGLPAASREPVESRFRAAPISSAGAVAGGANAAGTLDRTAQMGRTYRYTAQRVRTVVLSGQTLELRSAPTAEVTVAMRDVFPPEAPAGLVAVPGFAGEGETPKSTIDLSWDPNMEPRIAGYRVYRRDLDGDAPRAWRQLDAELVRVTAYRDLKVIADKQYAYRVTAVNETGNESGPSADITETAPAQ